MGYSQAVTHPSTNPVRQGLINFGNLTRCEIRSCLITEVKSCWAGFAFGWVTAKKCHALSVSMFLIWRPSTFNRRSKLTLLTLSSTEDFSSNNLTYIDVYLLLTESPQWNYLHREEKNSDMLSICCQGIQVSFVNATLHKRTTCESPFCLANASYLRSNKTRKDDSDWK